MWVRRLAKTVRGPGRLVIIQSTLSSLERNFGVRLF
jgi:hypothetical protein